MSHWMQTVRNVTLPLIQWRARKYAYIRPLAIAKGIDCEDTREVLNFFLQESELSVDDKIKSEINSSDFVEIYDRWGVQIFRSFNIYKVSSFSVDDLETKRMDQLFGRPEFLNQMLVRAAMKVFSQKLRILTQFCPPHKVVERKANAVGVQIEYNFMAPVYDSVGAVVGVLVSEKLTPLEVSVGSSDLFPEEGANTGLQTLQS